MGRGHQKDLVTDKTKGRREKPDCLPIIRSGMDDWVGSKVIIKFGNTRIEKHIEGQTLWPNGNVQWAADDTGLKLRRGVQCHSLWHLLVSQRGARCLGEERSIPDFVLCTSLGSSLQNCGQGPLLFHMQYLSYTHLSRWSKVIDLSFINNMNFLCVCQGLVKEF